MAGSGERQRYGRGLDDIMRLQSSVCARKILHREASVNKLRVDLGTFGVHGRGGVIIPLENI